jgi:hypothetical protein
MKAMWLVYAKLVVGLVFRDKILKTILRWNKKWQVTENHTERGDTHTLVLKPGGHRGFSLSLFEA